jgi:hypothetical protein
MDSQASFLILRPKKAKTIQLILLSLMFCVGGWWMISRGETFGWVALIFFGLGFLIGLVMLLPNASQLKLTPEGFEVTALFRKRFTKWDEVTLFRVGAINGQVMVVFDYTAAHQSQPNAKRFSKTMAGWEGAVSNQYDITPEALADLLNEWRFLNTVGSNP